MIITNITGGLGNQLFQYTLGKKISLQNNSELKFDTSSFKTNQARNFKLDIFNIPEKPATPEEIKQLIPFNKISKKIFTHLQKIKPPKNKKYYQEPHFQYDTTTEKLKSPNLYIEGYWQSEKYFKNIEDTIRTTITLNQNFNKKYSELLKKLKTENSISIHFRKTDYITGKHAKTYHDLTEEYYQSAIKIIKEKINNPTFFIFSDDINWVKNNINLPSQSILISNSNTKDYEELILMSKCKNNIIANSSFSWWGAWLNQNQHKIIISPLNWFTNKNINTKDLIPKSWIKI